MSHWFWMQHYIPRYSDKLKLLSRVSTRIVVTLLIGSCRV
ncbi:hypothetical protein V2J09_018558 [Rumex salicifolius]